MTLPYNSIYKEYANDYLNYDNGIFIDSTDNGIKIINPNLTSHDANPIFKIFKNRFNPKNMYAPYRKEDAINCLKENIDYLSHIENLNFDGYLKLKLYRYFLQVYSSDKTKIRENDKDVIELFDTTGYYPYTYYEKDEFCHWHCLKN